MLARSEKIKLLRLLFRISQSSLASRANIKTTVLNKLEQDKYTPPISVFEKLANVANVNLKWFLQDLGPIFTSKLVFTVLSGEDVTRGSRSQKDLLDASYVEKVASYLLEKQYIESCCFLYSEKKCYIICETKYDIARGVGHLNEECQYLVIRSDLYLAGIIMSVAQNNRIRLFPIEDKQGLGDSLKAISEALDNFYSTTPTRKTIGHLRQKLEEYISLFDEKKIVHLNSVLNSFYHDLFGFDSGVIKETDVMSPTSLLFEDKPGKIVQYAKSIGASIEDLRKALKLFS